MSYIYGNWGTNGGRVLLRQDISPIKANNFYGAGGTWNQVIETRYTRGGIKLNDQYGTASGWGTYTAGGPGAYGEIIRPSPPPEKNLAAVAARAPQMGSPISGTTYNPSRRTMFFRQTLLPFGKVFGGYGGLGIGNTVNDAGHTTFIPGAKATAVFRQALTVITPGGGGTGSIPTVPMHSTPITRAKVVLAKIPEGPLRRWAKGKKMESELVFVAPKLDQVALGSTTGISKGVGTFLPVNSKNWAVRFN